MPQPDPSPTASLFTGDARRVCRVLAEDVELRNEVPEARRESAVRRCIAGEIEISRGNWWPAEHAEAARGGFGLLIIEGLLVRRVGRDGRFGCEVLGPRDVVRPWGGDGEQAAMPFETSWRVMTQTRLAALDLRFAYRAAPYPEIAAALMDRAMQRSRALAVNMAIARNPRVDRRLLLLLWHLADRWGKVHHDGIHLSLPLTHELLGELIVAQRSSVTLGLKALRAAGAVVRSGNEMVLVGEPPGELGALAEAPPRGGAPADEGQHRPPA